MLELSLAREICPESVASLKQKATERSVIDEIPVFSSEWQKNRGRLPSWLKLLEQHPDVFRVTEVQDEEEEILSSAFFGTRLKSLRGIELETQRSVDLEEGFIRKPDEFIARDEDWTDGTK